MADGTQGITRVNQGSGTNVQRAEGRFGRYSVVAVDVGEVGKAAAWEARVETSTVSWFERAINWFTGHLNKEKNAALITMIETGKIHNGSLEGAEMTAHDEIRFRAFEDIIAGKTKATYQEKLDACKAMMKWIESERSKVTQDVLAYKHVSDPEVQEKLASWAKQWCLTVKNLPEKTQLQLALNMLTSYSSDVGISVLDLAKALNKLVNENEDYSGLHDFSKNLLKKCESDGKYSVARAAPKVVENPPQLDKGIYQKLRESTHRAFELHQDVYVSFIQTKRFRSERAGLLDVLTRLHTFSTSGDSSMKVHLAECVRDVQFRERLEGLLGIK